MLIINYLTQLLKEYCLTEYCNKKYLFFKQSPKSKIINEQAYSWKLARSWNEVEESLKKDNEIAVILTIKGTHVFNSRLEKFGKPVSEKEVLENIRRIKQ